VLVVIQLVLQVSAYSSFARVGVGLGSDQQRRRMDATTNEPLFTNCTRDFIGTLDYIFYTGLLLCNMQFSTSFALMLSSVLIWSCYLNFDPSLMQSLVNIFECFQRTL
jgi:hypothetical protein